MNTVELLDYISGLNKFLVSDGPPKVIDVDEWIDLKVMGELKGEPVLSKREKEELSSLPPLELPVTTLGFNCPIENKKIFLGLYYYDVGGWLINSISVYYIINYDIVVPDDLVCKIKALSLRES
ncbi:hypothetical protein HCH_01200 [Hahella chejuensis KCTC 2396]|uniref:Uncharacterized protein n=1 Tax=Hahella chejuensis (strain KCTC 2396) TaxID=349521 RepID=Q2SMQ1_HAHCH|nr:hypothetical protein [Hahella chejuensis]ABC28073.1 hypothetical protein HCH_01200 [Hahella chejuensis KCTC 2396]